MASPEVRVDHLQGQQSALGVACALEWVLLLARAAGTRPPFTISQLRRTVVWRARRALGVGKLRLRRLSYGRPKPSLFPYPHILLSALCRAAACMQDQADGGRLRLLLLLTHPSVTCPVLLRIPSSRMAPSLLLAGWLPARSGRPPTPNPLLSLSWCRPACLLFASVCPCARNRCLPPSSCPSFLHRFRDRPCHG